jgi:hypothetical protein
MKMDSPSALSSSSSKQRFYSKIEKTMIFFRVPQGGGIFPGSFVLSRQFFFDMVFQTLRVWLISGRRFATPWALGAMILLVAMGSKAQATNGLSDAEVQGRQLVDRILEQQPTEPYDNTGILLIHNSQGTQRIPISVYLIAIPSEAAGSTNRAWIYQIYQIDWTNRVEELVITHRFSQPDDFSYGTNIQRPFPAQHVNVPVLGDMLGGQVALGNDAAIPFADSDFWICDLGLKFLRWPEQKVLKRETHRSRGCTVLESTNPHPSANGYSRVVSWVDNESLGIVEAYAYDANGKKLKDFYPKDFKKIAGRWQVQTLVMENVQTGSRSRLEFDLNK